MIANTTDYSKNYGIISQPFPMVMSPFSAPNFLLFLFNTCVAIGARLFLRKKSLADNQLISMKAFSSSTYKTPSS
jgi:hypothetical protein